MSYLTHDTIKRATNYLLEHKIDNAKNEIRWFLEKNLNFYQYQNHTIKKQYFSELEYNAIQKFIKRRIKQEPFQYILGMAPFYDKDFIVNKNVLIPRPETECMIDIIKKNHFINALDIGTGAGNISIILRLQNIVDSVLGIDVSEQAISVAYKNKKLHNVSNISFEKNNIFKMSLKHKFDLIVSNPPYINYSDYQLLNKTVKDYEPAIALTDFNDGYSFYECFLKVFVKNIKPGGMMLLEIGHERMQKNIDNIFKTLNAQLKWHKDLNGQYRFIQIIDGTI